MIRIVFSKKPIEAAKSGSGALLSSLSTTVLGLLILCVLTNAFKRPGDFHGDYPGKCQNLIQEVTISTHMSLQIVETRECSLRIWLLLFCDFIKALFMSYVTFILGKDLILDVAVSGGLHTEQVVGGAPRACRQSAHTWSFQGEGNNLNPRRIWWFPCERN